MTAQPFQPMFKAGPFSFKKGAFVMLLVILMSFVIMAFLLSRGFAESRPIVQRSGNPSIWPSNPSCSQPGLSPCWVTVPASPYAIFEIIGGILILPVGLWLSFKVRDGSKVKLFIALCVLTLLFCLTRGAFESLEEHRLGPIYHDVTIVGPENVLQEAVSYTSDSATAYLLLAGLALFILILASITSRPQKSAETVASSLDVWWWLLAAVFWIIVLVIELAPDPFGRIVRFVAEGIWVTISVTVISFVLTLVMGMFGGLGRLSRNRLISGLTSLYVEVIRGIPLLVQLMWWYFAFPAVVKELGKSLNIEFMKNYLANPIAMAVLGLVVCYAAYMSEIYRAGIQSIPRGQMEAARSLGMNYVQSMRYVILPQAIRVILPPVGNEFIALLKDSSLVSAVAIADLSRRAREFSSSNALPIQTWVMAALLYLVMTLISARVVGWIERRTKFER